jgi:alcohol dehydrogenase YqhD (iron-dependent ADH family)
MENFTFYNPTKIIFGKDETKNIGQYLKDKKCLLLYGKDSIKKNGIYEKVANSLKSNHVDFIEKGGIKSNPVLSFVQEAIKIARKEQVDCLLAVGGGSVIDTAKAIACGFYYDGDVWDFFIDKAKIKDALPIYVVLTLAATASEMNSGAVITKEETKQKFNINSVTLFPRISVLDPVNTYTVSKNYVAYGCVDAMVHLLEGYFTQDESNTLIQDGFVEVLIRALIQSTNMIMDDQNNYNARADFMWAATLALNGLTTAGIGSYGFPNHMIGHSLSAIYDIAHGASLSIVFPAWLKYSMKKKPDKITQFGKAVFHRDTAQQAIESLENFFKSIKTPIRLSEINIPVSDIGKIAQNAVMLAQKWRLKEYTQEAITDILRLAI